MRLTDKQKKIVEDNHNLIYAYAHKRKLNLDEWYDLLAIELCKTVMNYNPKRGSLSNYFYLRCDTMRLQQHRNSNAQKRVHDGNWYNLDEVWTTEASTEFEGEIENKLLVEKLFKSKYGNVFKLLYEGYTQVEIAEMLGTSQPQISRIIRRGRSILSKEMRS